MVRKGIWTLPIVVANAAIPPSTISSPRIAYALRSPNHMLLPPSNSAFQFSRISPSGTMPKSAVFSAPRIQIKKIVEDIRGKFNMSEKRFHVTVV